MMRDDIKSFNIIKNWIDKKKYYSLIQVFFVLSILLLTLFFIVSSIFNIINISNFILFMGTNFLIGGIYFDKFSNKKIDIHSIIVYACYANAFAFFSVRYASEIQNPILSDSIIIFSLVIILITIQYLWFYYSYHILNDRNVLLELWAPDFIVPPPPKPPDIKVNKKQ